MKIHKFEEVGLGKAPFHLERIEYKRYSPVPGVTYPGDACDYCGTGIVECCVIRDANSKTFVVGNECVRHTGDAGLIDTVKRALNEERRKARHEKEKTQIDEAKALLDSSDKLKTVLQSKQHPYEYMAVKGFTLLDFVNYMYQNGGNAGKMKAVKVILENQDKDVDESEVEAFRKKREEFQREQEQELREERRKAEEQKQNLQAELDKNQEIIRVLEKCFQSDFVVSMIDLLQTTPLSHLTDKQVWALSDIYARQFGRRNARGYQDADKKLDALRYDQQLRKI